MPSLVNSIVESQLFIISDYTASAEGRANVYYAESCVNYIMLTTDAYEQVPDTGTGFGGLQLRGLKSYGLGKEICIRFVRNLIVQSALEYRPRRGAKLLYHRGVQCLTDGTLFQAAPFNRIIYIAVLAQIGLLPP